jgi:hypothetical protein
MKTIEKYIECLKTNITFKIGGNAAENNELIDESASEDLWFHIADQSSCHVVAEISNIGVPIDKKQLAKIAVQGAVICKQFSRYKSDKNVSVVYTVVENLTKTDIPGRVLTTNTKTITI